MQLSLPLEARPGLSQIRDALVAEQGPQRDAVRHDPTSQFFKAVISSCTRDAVSSAAFHSLAAALPSWEALADADPVRVAGLIAAVTYAADKAAHAVAAARIIRARRGRVDLDFLAGWPVDAAFSWLDSLPGAGPKVSAATLNFSSLRKPVLVVDRHVLRVAKRHRLVPDGAAFVRGYRLLMRLVPNDWDADDLYEWHWLVKAHGQRVCRVQRPACHACRLAPSCPGAAASPREAPRAILLRPTSRPGRSGPRRTGRNR